MHRLRGTFSLLNRQVQQLQPLQRVRFSNYNSNKPNANTKPNMMDTTNSDHVVTRSQAAAASGDKSGYQPGQGGLIYDLLTKDHRDLEPLLDRMVQTSEANEDTSKLLTQISSMLVPHSRAEEETFYNAIRATDPDTKLPLHGYKEHAEAEGMLRTLQGASMIGVEWTTKARALREALLHHIQEEETEIFTRARQLFTDQEARDLAKAFQDVKGEVMQQSAAGNMFHMMANMLPPWLSDRLTSRKDPLAKA